MLVDNLGYIATLHSDRGHLHPSRVDFVYSTEECVGGLHCATHGGRNDPTRRMTQPPFFRDSEVGETSLGELIGCPPLGQVTLITSRAAVTNNVDRSQLTL